VLPPYLQEAEEEQIKMKIKEILTSKRTWTLIGSLVVNLFQFATAHGLIK